MLVTVFVDDDRRQLSTAAPGTVKKIFLSATPSVTSGWRLHSCKANNEKQYFMY